MIGDRDSINAELRGLERVSGVHQPLDHKLARPACPNAFDVLPGLIARNLCVADFGDGSRIRAGWRVVSPASGSSRTALSCKRQRPGRMLQQFPDYIWNRAGLHI